MILARTVPFVAHWEGFRAAPYLCPSGVASIGYGSTHYADGRAVTLADAPIGRKEGASLLRATLGMLFEGLKRCLAHPPGINQSAAMLSLAYNIGAAAFASSTLVRLFNEGGDAAAAFLDWDKAQVNGRAVVLKGLAARRAAERALFLTPDSRIS